MPQTGQNTTTIKVRVQPKAAQNQIVGFQDDTLRVRVTAPPEDGKANRAVIALLSEGLGIPRSRVQIRRGHQSRNKLVSIESLDLSQIQSSLARP